MDEMLTVEFSVSWGISLQKARTLTDSEKAKFLPEVRNTTLVALPEDAVSLEYITPSELWDIVPQDSWVGSFCGSSGSVYRITREQWDRLAELDAKRKAEEEGEEKVERISRLKSSIKKAEEQMRDGKLPSRAEAKKLFEHYRNVINEGGDGFVPHYYCDEEYENLVRELQKLESE